MQWLYLCYVSKFYLNIFNAVFMVDSLRAAGFKLLHLFGCIQRDVCSCTCLCDFIIMNMKVWKLMFVELVVVQQKCPFTLHFGPDPQNHWWPFWDPQIRHCGNAVHEKCHTCHTQFSL